MGLRRISRLTVSGLLPRTSASSSRPSSRCTSTSSLRAGRS
jgi:hypothetical protein